MYLSRGNPVVYYGDEQGFTGTGGDQLARQTMFASQVPGLPGRRPDRHRPHRRRRQLRRPTTRSTGRSPTSPRSPTATRRCATAPSRCALASDSAGLFAFSRIDRRRQREYVVVLNNSEQPASGAVPTYLRKGGFTPGVRRRSGAPDHGPRQHAAGDRARPVDGRLRVGLPDPALAAGARHPPAAPAAERRSRAAGCTWPRPSPGSSFYEVTFQRRVGHGRWRTIGTDDSAPYQVFDDVSTLRPGTKVELPRRRPRQRRPHPRHLARARRGCPRRRSGITSPAGPTVTAIDPVHLEATVDPERAAQSVTFQRRVGCGAWTTLGTDTSSPAYTLTDDVSDAADRHVGQLPRRPPRGVARRPSPAPRSR